MSINDKELPIGTKTTPATLQHNRSSKFYIPLTDEELPHPQNNESGDSLDLDLSACSFDWRSGDSLSSDCLEPNAGAVGGAAATGEDPREGDQQVSIQHRRLEIAVNVNKSDEVAKDTSTSTPIKSFGHSRSRTNILNMADRISLSPMKEKSKTLPQNLSDSRGAGHILPEKNSFLLKSSPKIAGPTTSSMSSRVVISASASPPPQVIPLTAKSPRKSLSFIRRSHSTKVSRSSSLLRSFTATRHGGGGGEEDAAPTMVALNAELLERLFRSEPAEFDEGLRRVFFRPDSGDPPSRVARTAETSLTRTAGGEESSSCTRRSDEGDEDGVHSDTSYEKACRRGSAPSTPILGQGGHEQQPTISRFTNFFSKRSFRSNPLKRTKSVTKLERTKRSPGGGGGGLRGSRSHESLLSSHAVMSTIDLSCTGAVGVAAVHQSVLGRRHCFQVRGGPRGERYYSCGSRQERDLWIYSLRKSIQPNAEHHRHTDNSLKMWIYEAKALPPKKKYFCEILLDKTLFGRTSVKLRTDLLFWGEHFDFPDIPDINLITVNVYRECEKKKKREKHVLVGTVKIPIHEVTAKAFCEDWYTIMAEKHNSISRSSAKEVIPTLRIKCRFQRIDILPIAVYDEFAQYLREEQNYKRICELLEPVIGVKAKEDIGQAMVLLMHSQGMASAYLTDVVALDLLRVGDQRLTFRGNSLATKSMEAFLKLTGEQYLQDTLSAAISEIISSDRDCEVDPLKTTTGSLTRQQQSLRQAVRVVWKSIAESAKHFPPQLRECFATFRERLNLLDREDIVVDNLISASIFLRFLCPAILSPSLFNLTNELPSERTTRNLTLVAKSLQTLANFTRFQAKEGYMEYLNDFIEQEAPNMKEFLHNISTRSSDGLNSSQESSILEWSGYIDQGKQLSILHALLSENIPKLPANRMSEVQDLMQILDKLNRAKETVGYQTDDLDVEMQHQPVRRQQQNNQENLLPLSQQQRQFVDSKQDRGVIRGVLTPSSLEKNIFRYNDPTCAPLIQSLNSKNGPVAVSGSNLDGMASLPHSQSTSSISSAPNYYYNSTPNKSSRKMMDRRYPIANSTEALCGSRGGGNGNGGQGNNNMANKVHLAKPHEIKHISHHVYDGLLNNNNGNQICEGDGYRANTLPKNVGGDQHLIVSHHNNNHGMGHKLTEVRGGNLIQIGLDPSTAFVRKSPTPMQKTTHNPVLHSSTTSLMSDRSNGRQIHMGVGVPHNNNNNEQNNYHRGNYHMQPNSNDNASAFRMPMNLEDLDDLLKYADEHGGELGKMQQQRQRKDHQDIENGNELTAAVKIKPKELLTAKGSNNSIGQLSNMCSSGYQSISTQSQSSSPIETGLDYLNNKQGSSLPRPTTNSRNGPLKYQFGGTRATANAVLTRNSSLTPSSSEERLSGNGDHHHSNNRGRGTTRTNVNHNLVAGGNPGAMIGEIRGESELNMITSALNSSRSSAAGSGRRAYNRTPRTNPLYHNGTAGATEQLNNSYGSPVDRHGGEDRFQRRLSLESESARTLSDSSTTDTEGLETSGDGKRRRSGARSVEQYEKEIHRLQSSMDSMRRKLEGFELRDSNSDLASMSNHSDTKMRSIISRLIAMEEELRREQLKMSLALSHKQKVIEAQGQQIAALDAANNRLLSALSNLRQRYEVQQPGNSGKVSPTC